MSYENLSDETIRILEAQKKMPNYGPSGTHPDRPNLENMDDSQLRILEAQRKMPNYGPSGTHPDSPNLENMDDSQLRILEAQRKMPNYGPSGTHPDRPNLENMDDSQLRILEAQKKMPNYGPSGTHPDRPNLENMDDSQLRILEAQRKMPNYGPSGTHPDRPNLENMDDSQLRALQARVEEQRRTDTPYKEYFFNLLENPNIENEQDFENAVVRSMQSNGLIRKFVDGLIDKIEDKTLEMKALGKEDKTTAEKLKVELEQLVSVYVKYLTKLKENDWNFKTIGFDTRAMQIPESVVNELAAIQRRYSFMFNMPIPADLGEYYGGKFEREGKLVPGLHLLYENLDKKEVNWHQVMIYKENELTPRQRYLQRREEQMKKFEEARQQEITNNLSQIQNNVQTNENIQARSR